MCRYVVTLALSLVVTFQFALPAHAYLPLNCNPEHAKDDYAKSDAIVMGRVTAVERYRAVNPLDGKGKPRGTIEYFYLATITVGENLKGDLKKGDDLFFYVGSAELATEDDIKPSLPRVAHTHGGWRLEYDSVFLLFLVPSKDDIDHRNTIEVRRDGEWKKIDLSKRSIWQPRSCHFSIHRVGRISELIVDSSPPGPADEGPTSTLRLHPAVELYFDPGRKTRNMRLDEFMAQLKAGRFPVVIADEKDQPRAGESK